MLTVVTDRSSSEGSFLSFLCQYFLSVFQIARVSFILYLSFGNKGTRHKFLLLKGCAMYHVTYWMLPLPVEDVHSILVEWPFFSSLPAPPLHLQCISYATFMMKYAWELKFR